MNKTLKKIIWLSILVSMACILALLDKFISSHLMPLIPIIGIYISNIKIGLANVVILYIIDHFSLKYSIIGTLLKSIIIGFIYSSIISFMIGFAGTILSFITMYVLNKLLTYKHKYIFISLCGGFMHMLGQMIVVFIYYGLDFTINNVLLYSPIILIIGILCGLIIGLIYDSLKQPIDKIIK